MFRPDISLKKKLAPNGPAKQLFPKEVIDDCQRLIEDFKGKFFTEASSAFAYVEGNLTDPEMPPLKLEDTLQQIAALKGRAESLGLTLVARLLQSLQEYLDTMKPQNTRENIVVKKHMEALMVCLHEAIMDDGGQIGRDLLMSIDLLKRKT